MNGAITPGRCPVCGADLTTKPPVASEAGVFCPRPYCGVKLHANADGTFKALTFQLALHDSWLVFPFSFGERRPLDAADGGRRWRRRLFSKNNPADVERTEYFLPYVRRFLFPGLLAAKDSDPASLPCQHFEFDLALLGPLDPKGRLPFSMKCRDVRKNIDYESPLLLLDVELLAFTFRVGFVLLRVASADDAATYFDQMLTLDLLRPIAPLYADFQMPQLNFAEKHFQTPQLLSYLLAEFADKPSPVHPAEAAAAPPAPVRPVYDDRMMVYSFSCIDRDTILPEQRQTIKLLRQYAVVPFEADEAEVSPERVASDGPNAWMNMRWQSFSKDGGGLVVFDVDVFHTQYLGVYTATYYRDVFLLATLQRVALLTLYERLADIPGLTSGTFASTRLLRRTRLDLLRFKNQCWFSQITNRERGLSLWRKWQAAFENRTLLEEVDVQARELDQFLGAQTRERFQWLARLGGLLGAAVPFLWGMDKVLGDYQWVHQVKIFLIALVVVVSGLIALRILFPPNAEAN